MVNYQALFQPDPQAGGFVITFPDFGWGVSQAESEVEALAMAEDLLLTLIGEHVKKGEGVPAARKRRSVRYRSIALPALASAKVELYQAFVASGMRKPELARRIGIPKPNLDRLFDLWHHSRLDQLEAAFLALHKRIWFEIRDAA